MTWCSACKQECVETAVDFGIGPYEFHGTRGVDRNVQVVSDCCESEVLYDEPEEEKEDD
jgi:hypothetical protein